MLINIASSLGRNPGAGVAGHFGYVTVMTVGLIGESALLALPTYFIMRMITRKLDYYNYVTVWMVLLAVYFINPYVVGV